MEKSKYGNKISVQISGRCGFLFDVLNILISFLKYFFPNSFYQM